MYVVRKGMLIDVKISFVFVFEVASTAHLIMFYGVSRVLSKPVLFAREFADELPYKIGGEDR